jgi:hypothetical protein
MYAFSAVTVTSSSTTKASTTGTTATTTTATTTTSASTTSAASTGIASWVNTEAAISYNIMYGNIDVAGAAPGFIAASRMYRSLDFFFGLIPPPDEY